MFGKNKCGEFDCDACPRSNDREAKRWCPAWTETQWTNPSSGESKTLKSCLFEQLPVYMVEVIRAANRPAAAIESTRNEIAQGLANVANNVAAMITLPVVTEVIEQKRD